MPTAVGVRSNPTSRSQARRCRRRSSHEFGQGGLAVVGEPVRQVILGIHDAQRRRATRGQRESAGDQVRDELRNNFRCWQHLDAEIGHHQEGLAGIGFERRCPAVSFVPGQRQIPARKMGKRWARARYAFSGGCGSR